MSTPKVHLPLLVLAALCAAAAPTLPAPQVFEPRISADASSSPAFSPDGSLLLYARSANGKNTIVELRRRNGVWSAPHIASFSGTWDDMDPAFSPDGGSLVFSSARPIDGVTPPSAQLWRVTRTGATWGTPTPLSPRIDDGSLLVAPAITDDGTLYYLHIAKDHAHVLYRARRSGGGYATPEPLPFSTAATHDYDPAPAPDQSYVIFASRGRPHDGKEHLYIVFAHGSGWGSVMPLHYPGDGASNDASPLVARDGTLYFTSDRISGSYTWWKLTLPPELRAHHNVPSPTKM